MFNVDLSPLSTFVLFGTWCSFRDQPSEIYYILMISHHSYIRVVSQDKNHNALL